MTLFKMTKLLFLFKLNFTKPLFEDKYKLSICLQFYFVEKPSVPRITLWLVCLITSLQ